SFPWHGIRRSTFHLAIPFDVVIAGLSIATLVVLIGQTMPMASSWVIFCGITQSFYLKLQEARLEPSVDS
ncbi:MAG: hypothetical protein ACR2QF_18150, partial [Geminicoccaceae bacterium]